VARLLRPLEPVAAAGGWWCSGLDPLADWAPMAWGCFKPEAPRWDEERNRTRKYEHPIAVPARSFWLRVPREVAERIAARCRLEVPIAVLIDLDGSGGAFWRWWATEPRLPLVITEGSKKAGALLTIGLPAVGLPGIWNGCPKDPDTGRPELLADLVGVPLAGRQVLVLFDHSDKPNPAEPIAARRLGRLLKKAGAAEVLVGCVPGTHGKGADDHLANGGTWKQLAKALKPPAPEGFLPRLRPADRLAAAGAYLGVVAPIPAPSEARLVALAAAMGSGKTEAIAAAVAPLLAAGTRVVLITYRRSLGAALAERLGLPWGDDAAPGSDLRQQGLALCIDSLCIGSAVRFNPADWAGAVVVIDEAAQVLAHALNATGTAIADRRPEVLRNLAQLLAGAAQVIVADAQLAAHHLAALEAATGTKALLIGSEHRPAAGRRLVVHPSRDSWRRELVILLQERRRIWIACTAQKADSANSAQSLEILVRRYWPGVRVLRVDSETVDDPTHDASRLATDPNGIAAAYDVVIATPAVAAGLSVDRLPGHFAAVLAIAGGNTDPEAVAQAVARVRDDCPRHLFAPETAPAYRRVGCGSFDPAQLLQQQSSHSAAIVAQLAGTVDLAGGTLGPWMPLWAEMGAATNRKVQAYGATVRGLLEREGYDVIEAEALTPDAEAEAAGISLALAEIAELGQAFEDEETMAAQLLSDAEAAELQTRRRRLQPAERAQLRRWRIAKAWGLGSTAPTAEVIEADRQQRSRRGRFRWVLRTIEARQLVARHDEAIARQLAPRGVGWAPDLCRVTIGPKVTAADALGLPGWLARSDWFGADDPRLLELQALAAAHRGGLRQTLGISPGKTGAATLRRLLRLCGCRLESRRAKTAAARDAMTYRVVIEALPEGISPAQLEAAWREQLEASAPGGWARFSPTDKGGDRAHV